MIKFRLKELMDEKEMTIKEVHDVTKISRTTLSNMYHGKTNGIQFDNLDKLIGALYCRVEDLIHYGPRPLKIFFRYEDGRCHLAYDDGQKVHKFLMDFKVSNLEAPPRLIIEDIKQDDKRPPSERNIPILQFAHISPGLLDIFFYKFVDELLKENAFPGKEGTLLVSHQVESMTVRPQTAGGYTQVNIVDGRVNQDILKLLSSQIFKTYGNDIKVTVDDGLTIEFI